MCDVCFVNVNGQRFYLTASQIHDTWNVQHVMLRVA